MLTPWNNIWAVNSNSAVKKFLGLSLPSQEPATGLLSTACSIQIASSKPSQDLIILLSMSWSSKWLLSIRLSYWLAVVRLISVWLEYHHDVRWRVQTINIIVRFEVLIAASMKMTVLWVVAPCILVEVYQRFGWSSGRWWRQQAPLKRR
jgi:hypothetical protein